MQYNETYTRFFVASKLWIKLLLCNNNSPHLKGIGIQGRAYSKLKTIYLKRKQYVRNGSYFVSSFNVQYDKLVDIIVEK